MSESLNSAVRERPLLMSGPMVKAILDGRKTQTRRVITKINPAYLEAHCGERAGVNDRRVNRKALASMDCPHGAVGDRLWVREAWTIKNWTDKECAQMGYANAPTHPAEEYMGVPTRAVFREGWHPEWEMPGQPTRWTPSIHMPRWASRLTLEITEVRVQRLQEISEEDAEAEGFHGNNNAATGIGYASNREAFCCLWNDLNEKRGYGWDANPWVWAISFKPVDAFGSSRRQRGEAE